MLDSLWYIYVMLRSTFMYEMNFHPDQVNTKLVFTTPPNMFSIQSCPLKYPNSILIFFGLSKKKYLNHITNLKSLCFGRFTRLCHCHPPLSVNDKNRLSLDRQSRVITQDAFKKIVCRTWKHIFVFGGANVNYFFLYISK